MLLPRTGGDTMSCACGETLLQRVVGTRGVKQLAFAPTFSCMLVSLSVPQPAQPGIQHQHSVGPPGHRHRRTLLLVHDRGAAAPSRPPACWAPVALVVVGVVVERAALWFGRASFFAILQRIGPPRELLPHAVAVVFALAVVSVSRSLAWTRL